AVLVGRVVGRARDRDGGRRVDDDRDRRARRLVARVGDRGGDGVRARGERTHRQRGAGAEVAIAIRGPVDGRGAVLEGGGGPGGGSRRAVLVGCVGGGGGDGNRGCRVDDHRDRGAGRLAARVGDRGGDGVRARGEHAGGERRAVADGAVAVRR